MGKLPLVKLSALLFMKQKNKYIKNKTKKNSVVSLK